MHNIDGNTHEIDHGKDINNNNKNKSKNSNEISNISKFHDEKENAIIPYGKKEIKCYIDAYIYDESKEMDRGSKARYDLFSECYSNVDAVGFLMREKEKEKDKKMEKNVVKNIDKNKNKEKEKEKEKEEDVDIEKGKEREKDKDIEKMNGDDSTVCYGEVEYISFQEVSWSNL